MGFQLTVSLNPPHGWIMRETDLLRIRLWLSPQLRSTTKNVVFVTVCLCVCLRARVCVSAGLTQKLCTGSDEMVDLRGMIKSIRFWAFCSKTASRRLIWLHTYAQTVWLHSFCMQWCAKYFEEVFWNYKNKILLQSILKIQNKILW